MYLPPFLVQRRGEILEMCRGTLLSQNNHDSFERQPWLGIHAHTTMYAMCLDMHFLVD